jgi:DNA-binding MarR family transcriptional regulator
MTTSEQVNMVLRSWVETFMHRSMHELRYFSRHSGLSMTQITTLFMVSHGEGCAVTEISDRFGVSNAAASQIVERLVHSGYLERTEALDDRRVRHLKLTDQGREVVRQSIEARQQWLMQITSLLTDDEQQLILRALPILTEAAQHSEYGVSNLPSQNLSLSPRS